MLLQLLVLSLATLPSATVPATQDEGGDATEAEPATGAAFDPADSAQDIFSARCAACHGRLGNGNAKLGRKLGARDVTSLQWQRSRTDSQIRDAISEGIPGTKMRSFAALGSPAQFNALVLLVRSMAAATDAGPQLEAPLVVPPTAADGDDEADDVQAPLPTAPAPALPGLVAAFQNLTARWTTSLYGFVEFDGIGDSTQSFNDNSGNAALARPDTFAGSHGRLTFSVRNSRLGFKLGAPQLGPFKASAVVEMDFLGNQPAGITEAAYFTSPGFRIRHMAVKLETPWFELLAGQSWQLFGWQPVFQPATVGFQGMPGQVYGRAPQLRLSHEIKSRWADLELAIAASRPPQRDSVVPDGQAGVKLQFNRFNGVTANGQSPAAGAAAGTLGVSGVLRRLVVPQFSATPVPAETVSTLGYGVSFDALVPVIAGTPGTLANELVLIGSFVHGTGISDLYSSLTGGVAYPALPNPTGVMPLPLYSSGLDPGLMSFDASVPVTIDWDTWLVGLRYRLPPTGQLWISANCTGTSSANAQRFGAPGKVFNHSLWADVNVFFDLTPAIRFAAEYAWYSQTYADGMQVENHRAQLAVLYLF